MYMFWKLQLNSITPLIRCYINVHRFGNYNLFYRLIKNVVNLASYVYVNIKYHEKCYI